MTSHRPKTWLFFFSKLGQQRLVAQDRRIRRKAVAAGLRLKRLRSAPWGLQLVNPAGQVVRHSHYERDLEGFLDCQRAQRKAVES